MGELYIYNAENLMSGLEASQFSAFGGGQDKESDIALQTVSVALLAILVLFGFAAVVAFAFVADYEDNDDEDITDDPNAIGDDGGGGGSLPAPPWPVEVVIGRRSKATTTSGPLVPGPGVPAPPHVPPVIPDGPPHGTSPMSPGTPMPPMTTSQPPSPPPSGSSSFSVTELVCTVGDLAVLPAMVPPDGLCHYLYYSDVVVSEGALHGSRVDTSWRMFRAEIHNRNTTKGGIAFDINFVNAQHFEDPKVIMELNALASMNMRNYGLLNVVTKARNLVALVDKAKQLLQKFKDIQGNNHDKKTIIAIGLYDYNAYGAWNIYQSQFKSAVEDSMADTVIALSSTGWQGSDEMCYAAPPSAFDSSTFGEPAKSVAKAYPDLKNHATLVAADVQYSNSQAKLGLSFELGTLYYKMDNPASQLDAIAYAKCKRYGVTHLDIVACTNFLLTRQLTAGVKVGHAPGQRFFVYLWDDKLSLDLKVGSLKRSSNLRGDMSWLLLNTHLGDMTEKCEFDPFHRVKVIKNELFRIP